MNWMKSLVTLFCMALIVTTASPVFAEDESTTIGTESENAEVQGEAVSIEEVQSTGTTEEGEADPSNENATESATAANQEQEEYSVSVLFTETPVENEDESMNSEVETSSEPTGDETGEEDSDGDALILNRPEQSEEVNTELGDTRKPDKIVTEDTENTEEKSDSEETVSQNNGTNAESSEGNDSNNSEVNLPAGYEMLLGEDGIFRVTYTISEDCDLEKVTIDLNKAMEHARQYCGTTDSTWVQPGDTRIIQFYIQSASGHTYRYIDGSFVLTTADLGTNQTQRDKNEQTIVEEPKEGDVVGFDDQVLREDDWCPDHFELSITSPSVEELFVQLGFFTQEDADGNWQRANLTYNQYNELKKYLKETYGTDDVTSGMQKYLLAYYSKKDGIEYQDFNTMMKESACANVDLYTGTQTNKILGFEQLNVTNQSVANTLIGNWSASMSVRFPALQNLLNEKLGTAYDFSGTSSSNWGKLKDALFTDGYTDVANLIPTGYSNSSYIMNYLAIYDLLNGEGSACNAYLDKMGYDRNDFVIKTDATAYDKNVLSTDPEQIPKRILGSLDPATRYDNFYKTLLSALVVEEKKDVDVVTGGQSGIVQTVKKSVYTVIDADDGKVYENCVPAYELGPYFLDYVKRLGLPENTLACADNYIFAFGTQEGGVATTDHFDGEVAEIYVSKMPEYTNDSWSRDQLAPQLADYMRKNNEAWKDANALFNKLLGEGIDEKKAAVTAFMAFNLDGELTGNKYQDTEWSWASSIQLEKIDGELTIQKYEKTGKRDEDKRLITESETKFALWKVVDNTKHYLVRDNSENADRSGYKWVEETDDSVKDKTISTIKGEIKIKYKLLEDMVYYLQEKEAPKGYELDSKIYTIDKIDSEKPVTFEVFNKKKETPETPETPKPNNPVEPPYTPETGTPYTPATGRRRPYTPSTGDSSMFLFGGLMLVALLGCATTGKKLLENH